MFLLCILLSLETPLRLSRILLTTPINTYVFSNQLDTPEDLFLSYPSLNIKNDTLYFRGSSKVLLLLDGVPISSLKDVCFPSIEKVEVVAQDVSSLYGDYDAVVNVITKNPKGEIPYSKVKLYKNPDHMQFEFGREILKSLDFYLTGDLNSTSHWSVDLGYTIPHKSMCGTTLQAYFSNEFILQGSFLSNIKFYLKRDFFSVTNLWSVKDHKILLGTENINAFFIQDYWEPYPLLYVVPGLRYGGQFYPKISVGYIPHLNMIAFGSLTRTQILLGLRVFDSSICVSKNNGYEIEANVASPWVWDVKLTIACYLPILSDYQSIRLSDHLATILEYRKEFKEGNLGVYVFGDLNNLRVELKIIDVKVFYRLCRGVQLNAPTYGLSWEFWD